MLPRQPQRIRVRGDENAPIGVFPTKTIHQRNKSTPVLSTALQNGGLRNAAKRTAFGDVSNISNPVRASKDDSHVAGKNIPLAKPGISAQEKKVFGQRAQRPASVMGVKTILNNTGIRNGDNAEKQALTESHNTGNTRKLLTKRSNVVFKNQLPAVTEVKSTTTEPIAPLADDAQQYNLVERLTTTFSEKHATKQDTDAPQEGEATGASHETTDENKNGERVSSSADSIVLSALSEKDSLPEVNLKDKEEQLQKPQGQPLLENEVVANTKETRRPENYGPRDSLDLVHSRLDHGMAPSEPEEYWDDDEDYNDEDDGYVTARSYRSRSENTTGGAATVLFPKYNQKARREISLAKELVESSRTSEDVEEELWDTSMVAEYGEEIFQYMREMEVSLL